MSRIGTKIAVFSTVMFLAITVAQPAFADRSGHYKGKGHGYSAKHVGHYNRQHNRRYNRRHNRAHNRHYNRHNRHAYRHGRHRNRDRAAYLAGGLIVGSLITHAIQRSHEPVVRHRTYREAVVVDQPIGRRLFRDINGDCYERSQNRRGEEVLSALPDAECSW